MEALARTAEVAEARAGNPGRDIVATVAVDGPVRCDRTRVQQLLSNLLGNALTHGARDHPVVVTVSVAGGDPVLRVANQGEPIPPSSLARVFEPYWRPHPGAFRHAGGLGLGLYICSQIVKAHGGTLEVESSREDGTCFTARLPTRR